MNLYVYHIGTFIILFSILLRKTFFKNASQIAEHSRNSQFAEYLAFSEI